KFGIKLFDRTGRGLIPTEAGEHVLRHCRTIESELRKAGQNLRAHVEGTAGHVVIGTYMVALSKLLPDTIALLHQPGNNISLRLLSADTEVMEASLIEGDLDFIVGRPPSTAQSPPLLHEVLYHEPICVIGGGSHPLAAIKKVHPRQLLD